jgi:hypothetical protein
MLRRLFRELQRAVDDNPRDLQTRLRLAQTLRALGREHDAREELAVIAALSGQSAEPRETLPTLPFFPIPPQARIARPIALGEEPFGDGEPLEGEQEAAAVEEEIGDDDIVAVSDLPTLLARPGGRRPRGQSPEI